MSTKSFVVVAVMVWGAVWTTVGETASRDAFTEVSQKAPQFAASAGPVAFEMPVEYESADFIEFLDERRFVVGSVAVGSKLGIPRHGPVFAYDARSGKELWQTARESRPDGSYRLVATEPRLVLVGDDERSGDVGALDPVTGRRLWLQRTGSGAIVQPAGDLILVLNDGAGGLTAYDGATGARRWQRAVDGARATDRTVRLAVAGAVAVVIGARVLAFDLATGTPRWQAEHEVFGADTATFAVPDRLGLWSARGTLAVDGSTGVVRWSRLEPRKGVKGVYGADGAVLRVLADSAGDVVEALETADGRLRWTAPVEAAVVSPVVVAGGRCHLTTSERALGFDMGRGRRTMAAALPPNFVARAPQQARLLGVPDVLVIRGDRLVVWRDLAGICSVGLTDGTVAWQQPPYRRYGDTWIAEYSADEAAGVQATCSGLSPTSVPSGGLIPLSKPGPNPFLTAAERRHADVMANRRSDSLDKSIATGGVMNAQGIASSFARAQAAVDFGASMIAAAQAMRRANQMRAQEGLRQRFQMLGRAMMRRRTEALQGRFFLDPFLARGAGRGLTLVDLDGGERADFLYAPLVVPLLDFSVDLLCFALAPDGSRLVTVGLGFDPARYEPMTKWRWRLPRLMLTAFDVARVRFTTDNVTFARLEEANPFTAVPVPVPAAPSPPPATVAPGDEALAAFHGARRP